MARRKAAPAGSGTPTGLGYVQCDWTDGATRCRYPGSLSPNTGPSGPWYCLGHYRCDDPVMGIDIIQASQDYQHRTWKDRKAEDDARSNAYCEKLGLHTIEQKRAHFRKMVKQVVRKITNPPAREPGQDDEEART